jgi:hypothetical protein
VQTFWLTYMPGIELTRKAVADGVITRAQADAIDRGETQLFHHRHQESAAAGDDADFYRRYDVLFRTMPFLPPALRARLRLHHVPRLGQQAANAVGFVFDLANALRRLDKETLIFAEHYARQLLRQLPEILLGPLRPVRAPAVRPPSAAEEGDTPESPGGAALPPPQRPDAATTSSPHLHTGGAPSLPQPRRADLRVL